MATETKLSLKLRVSSVRVRAILVAEWIEKERDKDVEANVLAHHQIHLLLRDALEVIDELKQEAE